jgi:nucleotide-binding universal stress UspA family protein
MAGFHHILVPLDGTPSSELALTAAEQAVAKDGRLTLLRVVDLLGDHYLPDDSDREKIRDEQLNPVLDYLDKAKSRITRVDLEVETTLASGAPADAILDVASEKQVDAVAMCTHTEAKLRQFLLGSVAQRIMKRCPVPVIVVHPPTE